MGYELLNIYGPIGIHIYGLFIAIGILVFTWFISQDKRFTTMKLAGKFSEILLVGVIAAVIGGRLLYIIEEPHAFDSYLEWFAFWKEGFSVLGSIVGILFVLPWYLKRLGIPIFPFADFVSIYIPLLQAIARLGCFFAGCCYGISTTVPWAVIYTNPNTIAPLHCYVHPTQLYSATLLFFIFIIMYFVLQKILHKSGQLVTTYLMLASTERFIVDFWRADNLFPFDFLPFSFAQLIALVIFASALIGFIYASWRQH
ncbi:MAG TPA: prolipoprotein diacylglyceryl transferase [Candidatus Dependentiae bacterium]|nr:prolipoprotein diacylglyceryl transferase [Candidatus Dependentiae bacterium]